MSNSLLLQNIFLLTSLMTKRSRILLFSCLLIPSFAWGQSADALINQAVNERQQGNIKKSIDLLNSGLRNHPENLRIKLELASGYFAQKDYTLAKQFAQEVMASDSIPEVVRNNIEQFLTTVKQQKLKHQYLNKHLAGFSRHNLKFFSGHDSNANVAPEDNLLDIGTLDENSIQQSDNFYGLQYDYSRFTPMALSSPKKGASLFRHSGISLYYKDYSKIDSSDLYFLNARMGMKYTSNKHWYTQGRLSLTHIGLDEKALVNYYRLSAQGGYQFKNSTLSLSLDTNHKHYFDNIDQDKEGYHFSQTLAYKLTLPLQSTLNISAINTLANLESKVYSYDATEYKIALTVPITSKKTNKVRIVLSSSYNQNKYRGIEPLYKDKRQDTTHKHRIRLDVLNLYNTLDTELSYTYFDRQSNHDLHQYNRDLLMLSFKYPFGS